MAHFKTSTNYSINFDVFPNLLPQTTLFLHGNLASNRWWMPTVEELQKTATPALKGSVICAEFRGCGQSEAPRSEADVTMKAFAQDFIELVKSQNLGKINLVGHSTGGIIAAYMLALAPELFNKAYLLDPVGAEGVTFDNNMIAAFEAMKQDKNLTATIIGSTIHNNNPESSYFKNVIVEDAFSAVKTVGHLVLKALDGFNIANDLKNVTHPVKVVHGEFDQLLPVADSKKLAGFVQNGKFETLAGCGHCGNVENTPLFVKDFSAFLF